MKIQFFNRWKNASNALFQPNEFKFLFLVLSNIRKAEGGAFDTYVYPW